MEMVAAGRQGVITKTVFERHQSHQGEQAWKAKQRTARRTRRVARMVERAFPGVTLAPVQMPSLS
jgi:hypothetical protein